MANLHLIKELAEERNLTLKELAHRAGISENQIHVMVRTNATKIGTLEKIANVLEVPIGYFFDIPTASETFSATGNHNIVAKNIGTITRRPRSAKSSTAMASGGPASLLEATYVIATLKKDIEVLQKEIEMLKALLAEKERLIAVYERVTPTSPSEEG